MTTGRKRRSFESSNYIREKFGNPVVGLDHEFAEALAEVHSKRNMSRWIVGGLIYILLTGTLLSLPSILLFLPGIFIASIAAIPTYMVDLIKNRRVVAVREQGQMGLSGFLEMSCWTIWRVVEFGYPICLAIGFVELVRSL